MDGWGVVRGARVPRLFVLVYMRNLGSELKKKSHIATLRFSFQRFCRMQPTAWHDFFALIHRLEHIQQRLFM